MDFRELDIKKLLEENKTVLLLMPSINYNDAVAKVIKNIEKGIEIPQYKPRQSLIDEHREKVLSLLEKDLSGVRIHEELVKDGFKGSLPNSKKICKQTEKRSEYFYKNPHRT